MPHGFFDIGVVIFLASLAAIFSSKLRQQPMIGYVLAGVLIGPILGIVDGEEDIRLLAEIGIIMLLFILGMELPLKSFQKSYKVAVPITFGLIGLSLAATFGIGMFFDLSLAEKIVYGFIISLSSTAVAVKLLEDVNVKERGPGQIAISILIAQDLLFVPMIIAVDALGHEGGMNLDFVPKIIGAVVVLIGLVAFLLRKEKIFLPFYKTVEKHKDLIPVAALAWCFLGAGLSELASLSPAYGAFLAGLVIGNSYSKDIILPKIEPMQNVLLMVFFLSIGMLIDFEVIMSHWGLILGLLLAAMVFKTLSCITLLLSFLPAERWRCSFITGLTISQVGEFSFIIAAAALANGIFDPVSYKVIIAVIALSLAFSPIWLMILSRFVEITFIEKSSKTLWCAVKKVFGKSSPAPEEIAAE